MKKTLCVLLAVCSVGISMVSCNKKAQEGYQKVEDETCDFSFECPESWEITHTEGMLSAINPEDVSKANVTAYSFPHGLETDPSAIKYWVKYRTQLADIFGEIVQHKEKEIQLGGQNVAHTDYTVIIGGESFDCETILAVYGGKVYTLTLTQGAKNEANEEMYNDHSDEFAEIIKTFRIN